MPRERNSRFPDRLVYPEPMLARTVRITGSSKSPKSSIVQLQTARSRLDEKEMEQPKGHAKALFELYTITLMAFEEFCHCSHVLAKFANFCRLNIHSTFAELLVNHFNFRRKVR